MLFFKKVLRSTASYYLTENRSWSQSNVGCTRARRRVCQVLFSFLLCISRSQQHLFRSLHHPRSSTVPVRSASSLDSHLYALVLFFALYRFVIRISPIKRGPGSGTAQRPGGRHNVPPRRRPRYQPSHRPDSGTLLPSKHSVS